jgi:hypothetical protein
VPAPDAPGVGARIATLLTTDGGTAAREADAFSTCVVNIGCRL